MERENGKWRERQMAIERDCRREREREREKERESKSNRAGEIAGRESAGKRERVREKESGESA